jgi:hypothetical protein
MLLLVIVAPSPLVRAEANDPLVGWGALVMLRALGSFGSVRGTKGSIAAASQPRTYNLNS